MLTLSSDFILVSEKTFYVPSFSQNLISISRLVPLDFSFTFKDNVFNLFHKSNHIGTRILVDGLYIISQLKPLIIPCMFVLVPKGVILMRILIYYDIID